MDGVHGPGYAGDCHRALLFSEQEPFHGQSRTQTGCRPMRTVDQDLTLSVGRRRQQDRLLKPVLGDVRQMLLVDVAVVFEPGGQLAGRESLSTRWWMPASDLPPREPNILGPGRATASRVAVALQVEGRGKLSARACVAPDLVEPNLRRRVV